MNFKLGDNVSILNEKAEGVVTAINRDNSIDVCDKDGFTRKFREKELILLPKAAKSQQGETYLPLHEKNNKGVYLFYIPKNNCNNDDGLDLFLVNNTDYSFYAELYQIDNNKKLMFYQAQINAGNTSKVVSINAAETEMYCNLWFQCLFNLDRQQLLIPPLQKEIKIKADKFFKPSGYCFSNMIKSVAINFCVASETEIITQNKNINIENIHFKSKDENQVNKNSKPHHYNRKEEEFDLHITEIIEDFTQPNHYQYLELQLNLFRKKMDEAIQQNYASVVFIHGVGKGILKEALLKELIKYKGIKYYEASYQKYGKGALKVEFI